MKAAQGPGGATLRNVTVDIHVWGGECGACAVCSCSGSSGRLQRGESHPAAALQPPSAPAGTDHIRASTIPA